MWLVTGRDMGGELTFIGLTTKTDEITYRCHKATKELIDGALFEIVGCTEAGNLFKKVDIGAAGVYNANSNTLTVISASEFDFFKQLSNN